MRVFLKLQYLYTHAFFSLEQAASQISEAAELVRRQEALHRQYV